MPKSSPSELADLRKQALKRDGGCIWPECEPSPRDPAEWLTLLARTPGWEDQLEMAHLHHRGMGGSREANRLDNVVMLCKRHHDLFDGRTHDGLHRELAALLRTLI